jgi:hypothetical protein
MCDLDLGEYQAKLLVYVYDSDSGEYWSICVEYNVAGV